MAELIPWNGFLGSSKDKKFWYSKVASIKFKSQIGQYAITSNRNFTAFILYFLNQIYIFTVYAGSRQAISVIFIHKTHLYRRKNFNLEKSELIFEFKRQKKLAGTDNNESYLVWKIESITDNFIDDTHCLSGRLDR